MFPIRDDNIALHRPVATYLIVALNAVSWMLIQGFGSQVPLAESICTLGMIPGELLGGVTPGTEVPVSEQLACILDGRAAYYTPLTSMFLHGSWLHIIGNMWFLWLFGDNVEDVMGPVRFVLFYLLCGLAAATAQLAADPSSLIPMVGASGAIGGVMGAYARLYPKVQIEILVFLGFYVTVLAVPAVYMLGYWFLLQFLSGLPALGSTSGGVAFWAHVGGFGCGLLMVPLFVQPHRMRQHAQAQQHHQYD
jgi:membrane associated rhomboid family serine protease